MRNVKELLELMLENKTLFSSGLCNWAHNLYYYNKITLNEYNLLDRYIASNRPKWYSSIDACKHKDNLYFWEPKNIEPRLKWINKHIKLNS